VADKLFSSFDQDILDALYWTATKPRGRKQEYFGLLPHLCISLVYIFIHSLIVLIRATTLNVAKNSQNKALLTIMLSNNLKLKSMPQSQSASASSSIADITARAKILQETLEPNPLFSNRSVSFNSLGMNENILS
ncbi:transmembrane anterior posterior transformation protein 1 homolog, partial [Trichonephila inaurata madagascariensis]